LERERARNKGRAEMKKKSRKIAVISDQAASILSKEETRTKQMPGGSRIKLPTVVYPLPRQPANETCSRQYLLPNSIF